MRIRIVVISCVVSLAMMSLAGTRFVTPTRTVPQDEWKAYFGNLHAHTSVSDGVATPKEAFEWARDKAELHFLCLSEHNHMSTDTELAQVRNAANQTTTATFIGIVGQEYSTIDGGNHVNVFDTWKAIPKADNSNYRKTFEITLPTFQSANAEALVAAQFNHPDNPARDYGIRKIGSIVNYNGDWAEFVEKVDPWVGTIAILNGPADTNTAKNAVFETPIHRDVEGARVAIWHTYLDRGFHLSPAADQDNHRRSWGTRTHARTGVWVRGEFNRRSLLQAIKASQTFATEDANLSVWFTVENKPIGSIVADPGSGELDVLVQIRDQDEPMSTYTIHLYRERIGDGNPPALIESSDPVVAGEQWTTTVWHQSGFSECFFVHVDQESARDDAWTGPVWIDPSVGPETDHPVVVTPPSDDAESNVSLFVGSRNRPVYHYPTCLWVQSISPENLVRYAEPPAGKRLHQNCPTE